MKNILLIVVIILFSNIITQAEKYALIIAIGDYPKENYWPDISSKNDVDHVKAALVKIGFNPANITHLYDADATKKGIIDQLESLNKKLQKGDIVYIHYSGHGQQVLDDDGDELDNLDEAIVPYDSPMLFEKGIYEGEQLIRDDMLGAYTLKMREQCGKDGQVILVLDSCHSGTGTRGMGKTRGTDKVMAPDDFVININSSEKSTGITQIQNENLAPMASFYGASPRELNYETTDDQNRPVGSLSYAISSILANMTEIYSFDELYDRVRLKMKTLAPRQNPQWEGPENVLLLGGEVPSSPHYYTISEVLSPTTLKADIGTITDIYEGTIVDIYSKDKDKNIGRGTVTTALLTSSTITSDVALDIAQDELIVIKVIEKAYPATLAKVVFDLPAESKWKKISSDIKELPIIDIVTTNASLYITECGDDEALQIATADGSVLYTSLYSESMTPKLKSEIINTIRAYIQGDFLKSYENPRSNLDFSLEIVIVNCEDNSPIKSISQQDGTLKIGSCVQFKVTNDGVKGGYFSLIDIQPDNIINLVTPAVDYGYTADEYYLKPGDSYTTNYTIEIAHPAGQETLKLISSKAPLDLSGIMSSQGKSTRGLRELNAFEKMFAQTYNINTRGVRVKKSKEEVGAKTLYFNIVD